MNMIFWSAPANIGVLEESQLVTIELWLSILKESKHKLLNPVRNN